MTYEHVYVASVALHNQAQVLQAFLEAEKHDGPSIIVAYAPCVQVGYNTMLTSQHSCLLLIPLFLPETAWSQTPGLE
jgi:pyruvate/2-oxoacid:ferredoxin oxidoreductase beta subunit